MHQGVKQARGEWLLFTDADTAHSPLSISSSIAYAMAHKVDLLSLLPHFELCTPAERVVMPVAFMGIMNLYPPHRVNDPRSKIAIANGQYMLIRREVYDAVGGIARVKEKIAEDLEFAQVVKSADYYLYIAEGMHLVSVRMYTNFGEIWEGWGKLSFKGRPVLALMTVSGVFFLTLMPVLMGIWASQAWRSSAQDETLHNRITAIWTSLLAGWCVLMPLTYRRRIDKTLGLGPGWTLTQPVGVIIMAAIMLSSFIRLLTGKGVIWKGRTYHGE
jgi:chlorobactene glucosyltransferase